MSSMTVPERISEFLAQRRERMYCDSCIQERLGLKWRQQVQLIAATLAVTKAFSREVNTCCTCQEVKQVTKAVSSPTQTEASKAGADNVRRERRLEARFRSPVHRDGAGAAVESQSVHGSSVGRESS